MHIFRSYDIRGVYGSDLDETIMNRIGRAFALYVKKDVVVARDCRLSSPSLHSAFISGAISQGIKVHDAGMLPLGAGMFHAWRSGKEFAYVTGSHLPKEWNGVKFFHSNGIGFLENENIQIKDIFLKELAGAGNGISEAISENIADNYVRYIVSCIKSGKRLSVAIDNGNGVSSMVTKHIFSQSGHDADIIFEVPDGNFPNRLPDPIDNEITKLKEIVSNYDVGVAYDGDGDRFALVDENGSMLSPEQISYVILSKLLRKEEGPIIANIECTRLIDDIAGEFGRDVIRAPVGHTFLMQYVNAHNACYGVESAGHYCLPSITPFDDAIPVSLYAISVLSESKQSLSELVRDMPVHVFKRTSYECQDDVKFDIMRSMKEKILRQFSDVNTIDGVRVDMQNGWALLRASNTSPFIRLTVEGDTKKDFHDIQQMFLEIIEDEFSSRGLELKEEHGKK
jgi:phosphomannomutase